MRDKLYRLLLLSVTGSKLGDESAQDKYETWAVVNNVLDLIMAEITESLIQPSRTPTDRYEIGFNDAVGETLNLLDL